VPCRVLSRFVVSRPLPATFAIPFQIHDLRAQSGNLRLFVCVCVQQEFRSQEGLTTRKRGNQCLDLQVSGRRHIVGRREQFHHFGRIACLFPCICVSRTVQSEEGCGKWEMGNGKYTVFKDGRRNAAFEDAKRIQITIIIRISSSAIGIKERGREERRSCCVMPQAKATPTKER
jgi:hypothetical protein